MQVFEGINFDADRRTARLVGRTTNGKGSGGRERKKKGEKKGEEEKKDGLPVSVYDQLVGEVPAPLTAIFFHDVNKWSA